MAWPKDTAPAETTNASGEAASWGTATARTVRRRMVRVSPGAIVSQAGSFASAKPAARKVPRVSASGTPHFAEKAAAPRAWSPCSCETKTASSEAGSTPADCSRSAS